LGGSTLDGEKHRSSNNKFKSCFEAKVKSSGILKVDLPEESKKKDVVCQAVPPAVEGSRVVGFPLVSVFAGANSQALKVFRKVIMKATALWFLSF